MLRKFGDLKMQINKNKFYKRLCLAWMELIDLQVAPNTSELISEVRAFFMSPTKWYLPYNLHLR